MAATTYMTSAEATLLYDDAAYSSGERAQALTLSFGMFNGYLNSALKVPMVPAWNGSDATLTASPILKLGQAKFYEYFLRRGEVGDTPEVKEQFDAAVEYAQSIVQEQLTVPDGTTYEREVGWNIVSKSNTGGGDVFIRGGSPARNEFIKLVITNAVSASYPGTFTYSSYAPARSASTYQTAQVTSHLWINVLGPDGDHPFEIRWEGKWTNGDYVEVRGVSVDMVDAEPPQRNTLQQSRVAY